MLSCKLRGFLSSLAAAEDSIVHVGMGVLSEFILIQTKDALKARELVKGKVLENSTLTPKEVSELLCESCKAECVQVIGSKFVLYKRNEKSPVIELPKSKAKK